MPLAEKKAEIIASIESKINEIRILNEALAIIDNGQSPLETNIFASINTTPSKYMDIVKECADAIVENKTGILYQHLSDNLKAYMPKDVYEKVRADTLSTIGNFEAYDTVLSDKNYPNIVYQKIRYSKFGLNLKFVFHNNEVGGFWMTYYELT